MYAPSDPPLNYRVSRVRNSTGASSALEPCGAGGTTLAHLNVRGCLNHL